ncbi:patatin-like phospholipase family protein [candidate division CSSED10-310 bacterium]|uniref:Patatin-like phospholipase family protein n=1 Tax=candidate division CSSED10-310 bacterium TaxID=2855610 RepID=A0ABV6YRV9_UNCC1
MKKMNKWDFKKIAFVASGGGFKALGWHIGVAMALKEYGFAVIPGVEGRKDEYKSIDHVVGSSGGSIFAAIIANALNERDVQRLDQKSLLSYFLPFRDDKNLHVTDFSYLDVFLPNFPDLTDIIKFSKNFLSLPKIFQKYGPGFGIEAIMREILQFKGLFSLEKLEKFLSKALPINDFAALYQKNRVELNIVATEVNNPRKAIFGWKKSTWINSAEDNFYRDRYLNNATISQAVAASSSIVPIYKPTVIDGIPYVDGEIKQALSVHIAVDQGADLIFVSHTFKPYIQNGSMGELSDILSLIMQELYTSIYQKIQTPKIFHQQKKRVYDLIRSDKFRKKYNLEPKKHKEMVQEICDTMLFDPNRKYIFISSPNELFFMDHFNLLSYANREIMSSGYYTTRQVMDMHGFARLERFKAKGILEDQELTSFRFPNTAYERYKQRRKRMIPLVE